MKKSRLNSAITVVRSFAQENPLGFPLFLLLLALITYGIFISSLGFYWDDWPPLVVSHFSDPSSFWQYFSYDRPFQSWTYYLLAPICRDSAFLWQLSAIFFRWTSALSLYFTFLHLFPQKRTILQWTAILFVVFPGFSDQYASVAYGSHFITYTIFGLSLLTMVLAFKQKKQFWVFFTLSLALTAVHLFTMEYFVGLELLRPVILYILLSEPERKKPKPFAYMLKYWAPYLAVLAVYLYWRMALYPASMGGMASDNYPYIFENLTKTPLDTLIRLLETVLTDLRFLFISAWTDRLFPPELELGSITLWLSLLVGLVTASFIYTFLFSSKKDLSDQPRSSSNGVVIGLGFLIILAGMVPLWSTLRQITIGKWSGRFAIPAMWGIGLIIAALIFIAVQNAAIRKALFIILVGLSIGYQVRVGNDYRKDFLRQERFYTELKWRIPSLQPETALYSPTIPAGKEADYSFSVGINLMYSGDAVGSGTHYWMTGPRYYDVNDLIANPSLPITADLRTFHFAGTAAKVVSVYMPPTGCLWVLDPYSALMPASITDFANYGRLTNQALISETDTGVNGLSKVFHFNQENDWCFFFEKGDLAQSKGRWDEAISFYEQATRKHLVPLEGIEYFPFIRAYAASGRVEKAVEVTSKAYEKSYTTRPVLCQFWHDSLAVNKDIEFSEISPVYNSDICPSFFSPSSQ